MFLFIFLQLPLFTPLPLHHLPLLLLGPLIPLNRLINLLHLNRIIHHRLPRPLLLPQNRKHRILMSQHKILALRIRNLFFEDLFDFMFLRRTCYGLTSQVLFGVFLILNAIAPVIHPVHTVEMGTGDEPGLDLQLFELLVVTLLLEFLFHLEVLAVDLALFLLGQPHFLDVFH